MILLRPHFFGGVFIGQELTPNVGCTLIKMIIDERERP